MPLLDHAAPFDLHVPLHRAVDQLEGRDLFIALCDGDQELAPQRVSYKHQC
jgi:hypothetical protein